MARATYHGEIWWARADKERPVVIASRSDPLGRRTQVTCASVTRTIRGNASEVALDLGNGARATSVINCDDLFTIDKGRLIQRVGQLSSSRLDLFHHALRFALSIER